MTFGKSSYKIYLCSARRVFSSVGLEHYLDRVGVTGSNPVTPTNNHSSFRKERVLFFGIALKKNFS